MRIGIIPKKFPNDKDGLPAKTLILIKSKRCFSDYFANNPGPGACFNRALPVLYFGLICLWAIGNDAVDDRYLTCYRVLGTEPGCSWSELKLAYRRLVRRWHPDQRHQTPDESADEQIKAVNAAFDVLSAYYHRHGELPLPATKNSGTPFVASASSAGDTAGAPVEPFVPHTSPGLWERGRRFVLIGAALAIAYAIVANLLADRETTRDSALYAGPDQVPVAKVREAVTPLPEWERIRSQTPPVYFMPGSTIGEVIAAQGPPTRTDGNIWYYGESRVYFRNGRVTHWDASDANPLHTRLVAATPANNTATAFGMGSTKPEVRAAQGRPLLETDTMWDYGASRVFFKDGRVSGWEESPARPLHLKH